MSGGLFAIVESPIRKTRGAADASVATLHAQSLLDPIGVVEPMQPGERVGEFANGRYRYRLETTEIEDPSPAPALPPTVVDADAGINAPKVYRVALNVSWGPPDAPRKLRFTTLRVRSPPAEGAPQ